MLACHVSLSKLSYNFHFLNQNKNYAQPTDQKRMCCKRPHRILPPSPCLLPSHHELSLCRYNLFPFIIVPLAVPINVSPLCL